MLERERSSRIEKQKPVFVADIFFTYDNQVIAVDRGADDPLIKQAGLTGIWGFVPEGQSSDRYLHEIAKELNLSLAAEGSREIGKGNVHFKEDPRRYAVTILTAPLLMQPATLVGNTLNLLPQWMSWEQLTNSPKVFAEYPYYLKFVQQQTPFLFEAVDTSDGRNTTFMRVFPRKR